jgi:lactate racemase
MTASTQKVISAAAPGGGLPAAELIEVVRKACRVDDYINKRVLLIVPDGTRTAPVGLMFKTLFAHIGGATKALDVLIALGTHQPMSDAAIRERLEISEQERSTTFANVRFFNHEWNNPAALKNLGNIPADEINRLSGGLFSMDVPVEINRRVLDYDQLIIIGPVFPHEVVGFSGGNKYLF